MRDPDAYRADPVNKELIRVYKGDLLVGQIRRGIDSLWYAELGGGDRSRSAALHRVMLANDAVADLEATTSGDG